MCEDVEEEAKEEAKEEEEKKKKRKKRKKKKKEKKEKKKEHECFKLYQISNHLMQYMPRHVHTSMFTSFKSSALFISTAVNEQYSCQN